MSSAPAPAVVDADAAAGRAATPEEVRAHLEERSHLAPRRGVGSNRRTVPEILRRRLRESRVDTLSWRKVREPDAGDGAAGTWVPSTGSDLERELRWATLGLAELGIEPGDRVVILSNTRPEWGRADGAILCCGGVTVGIYPTSSPAQCEYIVEHSEARLVFCEDDEQLKKVEAFATKAGACPSLERLIVFEPAPGAIRDPEQARAARVLSLEALNALGAAAEAKDPKRFDARCDQVREGDLATIMYTSGTTGPPKGVMLTHGGIYAIVESACRVLPCYPSDRSLIFLPLAHSLQRIASYAGAWMGVPGAHCSSLDVLLDEIREIRPTVQASVPRIWEKFYSRIQTTVSQAPARRQRIFHWAVGIGRRVAALKRQRLPIPRWLGLQHRVAETLVFRKIRAQPGFDRVRYLTSGGAPISIEILEFFHAIGILIVEGYGLTETAAPATLNRVEDFKFGTVGKPIPEVRIRIAEDGEILIRGPGNMRGYYKNEAATTEAFTEDGWFKSGDIGEVDADGFLKITDRKKDLIKTSAGKYVAPQVVENLIKQCPQISQALVFGDKRKYCVGLITLDEEELRLWAQTRALELPTDMAMVIDNEMVKRLVDEAMENANRDLSPPEQVKRWTILPEDFTQDAETLTPTMKMRRNAIAKVYREQLDAMYDDETFD